MSPTAAAVFVLLRLVAALLDGVARARRARAPPALRMALANIHRPGALTPTIVLSLGLGIALLVTVIEIDGNLRQQFSAELPAQGAVVLFPRHPLERVRSASTLSCAQQAPRAKLQEVPMLRGRIVSANGMPARETKAEGQRRLGAAKRPRPHLCRRMCRKARALVAGKWWKPDYDGPPLVSFEKRIAEGLGLKLGDTVTVNVLGRNITARIANLRRVDWQNLSINFVMVFSPNTFRGAPHTGSPPSTFPDGGDAGGGRRAASRAVAQTFPMVTSVRVKEAMEAIGAIVANLVLAIAAPARSR